MSIEVLLVPRKWSFIKQRRRCRCRCQRRSRRQHDHDHWAIDVGLNGRQSRIWLTGTVVWLARPDLVGEDLQRDLILCLVSFHRLERVVAVPCDAFVDREQDKVEPIVVPCVEELHDMCKHSRVCPARTHHTTPQYKMSTVDECKSNIVWKNIKKRCFISEETTKTIKRK